MSDTIAGAHGPGGSLLSTALNWSFRSISRLLNGPDDDWNGRDPLCTDELADHL